MGTCLVGNQLCCEETMAFLKCETIISLLSFHVDSRIRSCWKKLQHVFLEILGWCDRWIIYNSEPYLNDLFFSWIHLSGQSPRGAWLRLSGDLEIKISWIAGNTLSTYWHRLCPGSVGFPECSTRTPRSEYWPDTRGCFCSSSGARRTSAG